MKHASSRELHAYWDEKRGTRPAPERADIEPGAIRSVLSDAFIIALNRSAEFPFRLTGTRVCALFNREMKGQSFLGLWTITSRPLVLSLLTILAEETIGTVAAVTAQNADGDPVDLELLMLPLDTGRPMFARAIGVLAPLKVPQWLGASPLGGLTLGGRRHVGPALERHFLSRFMLPRTRRGLTIYDGGGVSASADADNPRSVPFP
ncbi:MAG TPA: PAS domain-containing protein [Xanthobacteraceae bacterium]|jgi:hypothetical protein